MKILFPEENMQYSYCTGCCFIFDSMKELRKFKDFCKKHNIKLTVTIHLDIDEIVATMENAVAEPYYLNREQEGYDGLIITIQ